jgi:hypothetical protein
MAVAMACGYTLTDYLLKRDSNSAAPVARISADRFDASSNVEGYRR